MQQQSGPFFGMGLSAERKWCRVAGVMSLRVPKLIFPDYNRLQGFVGTALIASCSLALWQFSTSVCA
jgi:hypothetical protein